MMVLRTIGIWLVLCGVFMLGGCAQWGRPEGADGLATVRIAREFRGAWVATVSNINWPSKPGLPVAQQQAEAVALLDFLARHHFNAVIFQVRPQCDALYASELEPWSAYLTGEQGRAPEPYYDPLEFWIEAAHDRGLELHAWFNPYRAHTGRGEPGASSVVTQRPELARRLKNGSWWLDPALKEVQDYSCGVVMDVVRRYDIDGVHFDDYFYPYPSYNGGLDFPDEASWQAYRDTGGRLTREDWRRRAVNRFVERVYRAIKRERPQVKFGISPFGIWRPGYPESINGLDQYAALYADARLWLNRGWVDYFSPQLYWPIGKVAQSFPVLLGWWQGENRKGRHVWPGISVAKGKEECINQIMVTRGMAAEGPGVVHWSIDSVRKTEGVAAALLAGPYGRAALAPESPWLDRKAPARPGATAQRQGEDWAVQFTHPKEADVFHWVVFVKQGGRWRYEILNRQDRNWTVARAGVEAIAVSAVDRCGNESRRRRVELK